MSDGNEPADGGARPPLEEAQYVELLWPVVPTGEVDGALDWFSGVMAMDISHETWQNLDAAPREVQERASRVYQHEQFHFLQLVTMGFLFDWAADLFDLLRPVVQRVQPEAQREDFSGVKRLVSEGAQLLSANEAAALGEHFLKLDRPGRSGLTTRAILESHAHFAERRLNYRIGEPHEWTPHLHQAPTPVYRVAFDFLAFAAGYLPAYHWFSLAASMSLCSADPVDAFERLALALADDEEAAALSGDGDLAAMVDFVLEQLPDVSWSTPLQGTPRQHPMFTGVAHTLAQAWNAGQFDLFRFFARPDLELPSLLKQSRIELPIIFSPAPPSRLAIQAPSRAEEPVVLAMFMMGAVGRQLTRAAESASQARGEESIARLAWLVRDHTPVLSDLAYEDLQSGSPDRMLGIFDPRGENAVKAWGRIILRVPREIDPTQDVMLWRVPEARRLLRAIHQQLPTFAVYLGLPYGPYEWFGSIGLEEGEDEPDWSSPRIHGLVADTERAIHAQAEAIGQNAWLLAQCLWGPWLRA
jgi:hypothetical protein